MTFRAAALGNDNTTTLDSSFTITVPASVQAGDVLLVLAVQNTGANTFTITGGGTGSSWTTRSGPDDNNSNQRTYLWSKTATASSASSTVTVTSSAGGKFVGVLSAHSGVNETGLLVALATDTTADFTLSFASVPVPDSSGWSLVGLGSMRSSFSTAATVDSPPAGSVLDGQSNTVSSAPNLTAFAVHKTATVGLGAQSLGTADPSGSITDNLYTIGLAPGGVAANVAGEVATGSASAAAGEAFGSSAPAIATATAPAGVAVASSQDVTTVGEVATATADAVPGVAPALTIAATPEPDNDPPRVRLDVTDSRPSPATSVTVLRLDPNGELVPVRTEDGGALALSLVGGNRTGTLYDYEAPFGQQVTYTLEENTAARSPVTLDVSDPWLIHPGVPSRSIRIDVVELSERARKVVRGVFQPLGNRYPVVITDGRRKAPAGMLRVATETDGERRAMDALLDDAQTLLLNVPAGLGWGVTFEYVAVDESQERRLPTWGSDERRTWDLPYLVVGRPEGGSQAQWSYRSELTINATYADSKAMYATYAARQANVPTGA